MNARSTLFLSILTGACADAPASPGGPATISIAITNPALGRWAVQDGDGPFQLVAPDGAGNVTVTVEAPVYAVAQVCAEVSAVSFFHRASSETSLALGCSTPAPTSVLRGVLSSTPEATFTVIHGDAVAFGFGGSDLESEYELRTSGTHDLIAVREIAGGTPDRLHIERAVAVTGEVTRDLAFDDLPAPSLVAQPIPDGRGSVFTFAITETSSFTSLDSEPPFAFVAFAEAQRRSTDKYLISATVDDFEDPRSSVTVDRVVTVPEPLELVTSNELDALTVDDRRVAWSSLPGSSVVVTAQFADQLAFANFSRAWVASTPEHAWQVPELAGIADGLAGQLRSLTVHVAVEQGDYPDVGYASTTFERGVRLAGKPDEVRSAVTPMPGRDTLRAPWRSNR